MKNITEHLSGKSPIKEGYNDIKGSKYDSSLQVKAIAKIMRGYLKKYKKLAKFSVQSTHNNIRIDVVDVYFMPYNPKYWAKTPQQREHVGYSSYDPVLKDRTPAKFNTIFNRMMLDIKSELSAYNYDRSDTMTDYFDVNFYSDVRICYALDSKLQSALDLENYHKIASGVTEPDSLYESEVSEAVKGKVDPKLLTDYLDKMFPILKKKFNVKEQQPELLENFESIGEDFEVVVEAKNTPEITLADFSVLPEGERKGYLKMLEDAWSNLMACNKMLDKAGVTDNECYNSAGMLLNRIEILKKAKFGN